MIDRLGARHPVRALEGQTLVEVLQDNEDTLGSSCKSAFLLFGVICHAIECTHASRISCAGLCISPEGRGQNEAHISLPNEYLNRFPPPDRHTLEDVASCITPK